jgi:hypothetical protein
MRLRVGSLALIVTLAVVAMPAGAAVGAVDREWVVTLKGIEGVSAQMSLAKAQGGLGPFRSSTRRRGAASPASRHL